MIYTTINAECTLYSPALGSRHRKLMVNACGLSTRDLEWHCPDILSIHCHGQHAILSPYRGEYCLHTGVNIVATPPAQFSDIRGPSVAGAAPCRARASRRGRARPRPRSRWPTEVTMEARTSLAPAAGPRYSEASAGTSQTPRCCRSGHTQMFHLHLPFHSKIFDADAKNIFCHSISPENLNFYPFVCHFLLTYKNLQICLKVATFLGLFVRQAGFPLYRVWMRQNLFIFPPFSNILTIKCFYLYQKFILTVKQKLLSHKTTSTSTFNYRTFLLPQHKTSHWIPLDNV